MFIFSVYLYKLKFIFIGNKMLFKDLYDSELERITQTTYVTEHLVFLDSPRKFFTLPCPWLLFPLLFSLFCISRCPWEMRFSFLNSENNVLSFFVVMISPMLWRLEPWISAGRAPWFLGVSSSVSICIVVPVAYFTISLYFLSSLMENTYFLCIT